ncbi:hypothetical protein Noda2021_03810 [Candidatus Dependentiae bacterium Noda2021]|nr:hypothetical protein Noda2021_03810 [Candidatus Dependentiae bacterium Noda2021]
MRQASSDKYTIAWFKLAECVARGEREKALGVYRLLSHSIDDPAYAIQLEADILLTFGDYVSAGQKYYESALLYRANGRYTQAAALCEHTLVFISTDLACLELVVDLHETLRNHEKIRHFGILLCSAYEKQRQCEKLAIIVQKIVPYLSVDQQVVWLCKATTLLVTDAPQLSQVIQVLLQKALHTLAILDNQESLRIFLANLQALNDWYYQQALHHLHNQKMF